MMGKVFDCHFKVVMHSLWLLVCGTYYHAIKTDMSTGSLVTQGRHELSACEIARSCDQ